MADISTTDLYDLFLDTIGRGTSEICRLSDEEILYNLFEEFDAGVHSFLHEDNLTNLRHAGLIDDEMMTWGKEVRRRWLILQQGPKTVQKIKNNSEWRELFEFCDRLKLKASRSRLPSDDAAEVIG